MGQIAITLLEGTAYNWFYSIEKYWVMDQVMK